MLSQFVRLVGLRAIVPPESVKTSTELSVPASSPPSRVIALLNVPSVKVILSTPADRVTLPEITAPELTRIVVFDSSSTMAFVPLIVPPFNVIVTSPPTVRVLIALAVASALTDVTSPEIVKDMSPVPELAMSMPCISPVTAPSVTIVPSPSPFTTAQIPVRLPTTLPLALTVIDVPSLPDCSKTYIP